MTPKQTLIMWCLLGKHGEAPQRVILPRILKKDREALISKGLITMDKLGRAINLKVEDKGWRWANEHLGDTLPPNYRVLQNWLVKVHQNLQKNDQTLADFIGSPPKADADSSPSKRPAERRRKARHATHKTKRKLTERQLRARIEKAYLAVTNGRKSESALLSKVRAQLSDLDRATVDAGFLRILQGDNKARFGQISDPKALTSEDREAAFSPGGEPFHLLWIQP
jgi:hypothetical protein